MPDPAYTSPAVFFTEDEVKRRFVPFLKDFYKNRYQSDPSAIAVELDNVSSEGWVADGKLSFIKDDGSPFVCTYEATSRDKSGEVRYQLNTRYFLWDCSAFGAMVVTVSYFFFYMTRLGWLVQLKLTGNIGLLMGLFIIGFSAWYFLMQRWRKYRYIYAIEQFRRYYADEQWIALAEDVFPSRLDPYFVELRNQCVYNGIGLAIVPKEGFVNKICDPSRLGIFGKDRKIAHWVTRAEWYKSMSYMAARRPKAPDALTAAWNKIYRPVHYLLIDPVRRFIWKALSRPLGETTSAYTRFMRAQTVQKWITVLAIALLAPMFWKVISYRTENVADLEALQHWHGGKNPEDQAGYLIDGEAIPYGGTPTGVPKQYPISSKQQAADDGPTFNVSGDDDEEENTIYMSGESPKKTATPKTKTPAKTIAPKTAVTNSDPCAALQKSGWIVQESSFSTRSSADARATALKKQGINARASAQACLPGGNSAGYLVWLGDVYPGETSARMAADGFQKSLQKSGLLKGKLFVRALK